MHTEGRRAAICAADSSAICSVYWHVIIPRNVILAREQLTITLSD